MKFAKHTSTILLVSTVLFLGYSYIDLYFETEALKQDKAELQVKVVANQQMAAYGHFLTTLLKIDLLSKNERIAFLETPEEQRRINLAYRKEQELKAEKERLAAYQKLKQVGEFTATITAYNSVPKEGGRYNAIGKLAKKGTVAVSPDLLQLGVVKFGDKIHIKDIGYFVVEDTTSPQFVKRVDICFEEDRNQAINFGIKKKVVKILKANT
jgi:3D (Asp-Asp-Asp) domain-containing protein